MRNASNDRDDTVDQAQAFGRRHEIEICIPNAGFEVIEKAGQITLSGDLRAETEEVLNSYIRHTGRDRNARPSKETKAHLRLFGKQLEGMLNTLDHVNRKLTGESQYHPGIALLDQRLFHHAGISPTRFCGMLQSLKKELENKGTESARVGRPKNFFLAQFFCELEEIFLKAGGRAVGVTKTISHTRQSPFTDFVNAVLRFAPAGIGPSSSVAVAVAWERQLRSRRAAAADKI